MVQLLPSAALLLRVMCFIIRMALEREPEVYLNEFMLVYVRINLELSSREFKERNRVLIDMLAIVSHLEKWAYRCLCAMNRKKEIWCL